MLRDVSAATDMRHVILRYFDVAGADPRGRIGQSAKNAILLVKVACEATLGERDHMLIHGTDSPIAAPSPPLQSFQRLWNQSQSSGAPRISASSRAA